MTNPSGNVGIRSVQISGANQFTGWTRLAAHYRTVPFTAFMIDNSTTLNVTWTVQARLVFEDSTVSNPIDLFTSSAGSSGGVQSANMVGVWEIRVGVKAGNYVAGTATAGVQF